MPKNSKQILEEFTEKFKENLGWQKNAKRATSADEKSEDIAQKAIDNSVKERNIVIAAPGKGNKGTLSEIDSQFNADGSKKKDAVFTYSEPDRTQREISVFTSPDMSDREKLIFTAALFNAGSDLIMSDPMNKNINFQVSQVRSLIANSVRDFPLMTSQGPGSFTVNPDVLNTLDQILANADKLAKEVDAAVSFDLTLKDLVPDVTGQKKHLAAKGTEVHKSKESLMTDAYAAIDQYQFDNDLQKFSASVAKIRTDLNEIPKGKSIFKSDTRGLVGKLTSLISSRQAELQKSSPTSRRASIDTTETSSSPTSPRSPHK